MQFYIIIQAIQWGDEKINKDTKISVSLLPCKMHPNFLIINFYDFSWLCNHLWWLNKEIVYIKKGFENEHTVTAQIYIFNLI